MCDVWRFVNARAKPSTFNDLKTVVGEHVHIFCFIFVRLFICLFIYLFICLFVFVFVGVFICLSLFAVLVVRTSLLIFLSFSNNGTVEKAGNVAIFRAVNSCMFDV